MVHTAMMQSPTAEDIRHLLDWYASMGVADWADEAPCNWFAARPEPAAVAASKARPVMSGTAPAKPPGRAPVPPKAPVPEQAYRNRVESDFEPSPRAPAPQRPPVAPDASVMAARSEAKAASSLQELEAALRRFEGCGLKATAKNLCFYRGAPRTRIMLIGEAPGRDEDLQGKPFVGLAGQLLDRMLAAIGLKEADVHITNTVYWRPPGNRTPTLQETEACKPFLQRQIELVAPELMVLLGGAAAKSILDTTEGIMRLRGKWRNLTIGGCDIRVMATLHPAYLLRTPAQKRLAWRDLQAVQAALDG